MWSHKGAIPAIIVLVGVTLNVIFTFTPTTTEAVYGGPEDQTPVFQTPEQAALATSDSATSAVIDEIGDEPAQTAFTGDAASLDMVSPFGVSFDVPAKTATSAGGQQNLSGPGGISRTSYLPKGCHWPAVGKFMGGAHGRYNAQDIANVIGTPIVAACDGDVSLVQANGWNGGYGTNIIITDIDGSKTRYAHLSKILVVEGQPVKQGEEIAEMGDTGKVTGSHLHFQVQMDQ